MDISQIYTSFAAEWTDKQVDFDHEYGFQCVDLIRQYWYEKFNIGNAAGGVANATDYWNDPPSGLLTTFQKVATDSPQIGDVVVLNFNHIGISNGVVGDTTFQQLDQNGGAGNGTGTGADAIQIHTFERSQIMGVLRLINVSPPYTITSTFPSKIFKANKQPTNKYNITYYSFDDVASHVMETFDLGATMGATMIVNHVDGYQYYLNDVTDPGGYNIADWDEYVAPVPVVPYVPPAAPVTGTPVEKYVLVTTLKTYATAANAQSGANPVSTLSAGTYIVFSKDNKAYNLTSDNTKDMEQWVNTIDNVVPAVVTPPAPVVTPEPEKIETSNDIRASYKRFFPTNDPLTYRVVDDYVVKDMVTSGKPITIYANHDIEIYGTFVVNGHTFLRPAVTPDDAKYIQYYYGIPTTNINSGAPYLENLYDVSERIKYGWEKLYDKVVQTIEGIFKPKKQ